MTDSFAPKPKTPAGDAAGDPLAELARLIGQSDPFAEQPRKPAEPLRAMDRFTAGSAVSAPGSAASAPASAAPEWLARPASAQDRDEQDYAPRPAAHGDYAPHGDYADDGRAGHGEDAYAPMPSQGYRPLSNVFAAEGQREQAERHQAAAEPQDDPQYQDQYEGYESGQPYQGDDRYRVAPPPAGDYEADSYYAEDGHIPPQGEDAAHTGGRRRSGLITVAAVFGLAVIGTAGAFGYRAFSNGASGPANPPVIKADTTPAKIVAAPVAATADAAGKPFQDRVGAPPSESRLESREEQPVVLQTAPARAVTPPPPPQAAAPALAPAPAPAPVATGEPKRVKTVTIRPDGTETTSAVPSASPPAATPRAGPAKQQNQQSGGAGPIAITPQADPSPRTKTASRSPAASAGAYAVQITAQKSEAEAQSAYRAMQAKYPSVLGGRDANIRRAEIGNSGVWYRAQVGSFGTFEQATAFCNNLKDAGGQCIVQKN